MSIPTTTACTRCAVHSHDSNTSELLLSLSLLLPSSQESSERLLATFNSIIITNCPVSSYQHSRVTLLLAQILVCYYKHVAELRRAQLRHTVVTSRRRDRKKIEKRSER